MQGEVSCVKCYDKTQMKEDSIASMRQEVVFIKELGRHRNIAEVIETFHDTSWYYMVQPYYMGGHLVGLKKRAEDDGFVPTEAWWKALFSQCLEGLAHIHGRDIVHCDLKEPNIMLRGNHLPAAEVVIIDFGVAQRAGAERAIIHGTPGYIAPEVWDTKIWCPAGDMFSLGVVIVQVLLGKVGIFTENTRTYKEVKEATKQRLPPLELMPAECPSLQWLTKHLLAKDYLSRPTASNLLLDPWGEEDEEEDASRKLKRRHTVHVQEDVEESDDDAVERKESDRKLLRRHTAHLPDPSSREVKLHDLKSLPNLLPKVGAMRDDSQRNPRVKLPPLALNKLQSVHSIAASPRIACAMRNPYTPRTIVGPAQTILSSPRVIVAAKLAAR
jgi:serine/threonine protein kinase